jgi:hypothetical protein
MGEQFPGANRALSARSFTAKADGAVVSRCIGIHVASRRWLGFLRYLTMRALIITLALIGFSTVAHSQSSSEAELTTKRFAEALARFDVVPMVEELHPDVQQTVDALAIHIIETTEDKGERVDLLKALGVASPEEFKKLTPKVATVRFFEFAFSTVPKQAREASIQSKITIVGSIVEKDFVDVLYRSDADFKGLSMNVSVPSVVTLKRDGGRWKVASTTQFETMKAKLKGLTDGK